MGATTSFVTVTATAEARRKSPESMCVNSLEEGFFCSGTHKNKNFSKQTTVSKQE